VRSAPSRQQTGGGNPGDFYGADLAAIHAEGFGGLGAAAAGVVAEALGDSLSGARVWGLDLSA
jgi:hypothetical protein